MLLPQLTVSITSLVPDMSCLPNSARDEPTAARGAAAAAAVVLLLLAALGDAADLAVGLRTAWKSR